MPTKATTYTVYGDFGTFLIFNFVPFGPFKQFYSVIFCFVDETWIAPPKYNLLNLTLTFFDLVTLDGLDLTQGQKKHRGVLRSIPYKIHVVPSALFPFDTAALSGEASNDR